MITENLKNIGKLLTLQAITAITLFSTFQPLNADTIEKKGNGTFITEDFSCKVALADFKELNRVLSSPHFTKDQKKLFKMELETVIEALKNHSECKRVE